MDIATGNSESHPTPLPLNEAESPGLARPTEIVPGQLSGPTVPARDTTGEALAQMAADTADVHAAQAAGMTAEHDRRAHYAGDILPLGAAYGDDMNLPEVPPNVVPAEGSDLYPWSGQEPTPAGAGFWHPPGSMPQQ